MAKWDVIDEKDAPENLSHMTDEARQKREMLLALQPGKVIKVQFESKDSAAVRGFKSSLARVADKLGIKVEAWLVDGFMYIRHIGTAEKKAEAEK